MSRVEPAQKPSRRDQARATKARIVDAAAELFVQRGYGTTTLGQIADQADVAVQTVYFHFGNKRTVLKAAVDRATVGDDEPVALLDRPWMERVRSEADPVRLIELWVRAGRDIFVRSAAIMSVVRDAAAEDPEMAEQWSLNEQQRLEAFRIVAELLDERGALATGMSVDRATDVIFTLNSVEVYLLLTSTRGWSAQEWQHWLSATLVATLLD